MLRWEPVDGLRRPVGLGRCCLAAIALLLALQAGPRPASAADDSEQFLDALRSHGYFDTAADFLRLERTDRAANDEFKTSIPYQEGLTLVGEVSATLDTAQRERLLDDAGQKFRQFVDSQPQHKLVNRAKLQIANIDIMRARLKLSQADSSAGDKDSLRSEARTLYRSAKATATDIQHTVHDELSDHSKYPNFIPPEENELLAKRNELTRTEISAEWMLCLIAHESSKTFEPGSREAKQQLLAAAADYERLYKSQWHNMTGLVSRLDQARCLQEAGEHRKALDCLSDFLMANDSEKPSPELKSLRAQATRYAMVSWIAEKKYDSAIKAGTPRLSEAEAQQPDWLATRFYVAQAFKLKAEQAKDKSRDRDEALTQAVRYASLVANTHGEFQLEARKLLGEMGHQEAAHEPRDFDEARDQAQLSSQKWQILHEAYNQASPERQKEIEPDLAKERGETIRLYRQALSLINKDVPIDQVNLIYLSLSYLYLEDGNYPAAAVLAEHLARDYPDAPGARTAATYALKAWAMEYDAAKGDRSFEKKQLVSIAQYMSNRWPDSEETFDGVSLLLNFAVRDGDIEKALGYLKRIPLNSPHRGEAELKVGVSRWRVYLAELRKPAETRPPSEQLSRLRAEIEAELSDGVKRMQSGGTIDASLVGGVLSLAELYIDTNRPEEALKWLEDKKVGSLTLLAAGDPNTQSDAFKTDTYMVALRSYIGVLPQLKDDAARRNAVMKKAEDVMNALEKGVGTNPEAAQRLTQIYIAMGKELEGQLLGVRDDPKAREALSKAFEQFLARILQRQGNTVGSLIWVAETYYNLGSAGNTSQQPLTAAARNYLTQAVATYEQILSTAAVKPDYLPSDTARLGIQLRLALCYRQLGKFDKALDLFETVLKARPGDLVGQSDAAETLQDRGDLEDTKFYEKAILGDRPDENGRNVFWGWSRISRVAATNPTFESYFFRANYHSNECRYRLALKLEGARRTAILQAAKKGIDFTYLRFPKLGGPDQKSDYEHLLRLIQRALKEPEEGLKALDRARAPSDSANPGKANPQ